MECPTCRYPVPAEWSLCRRCGAPVHGPNEATRVTVPPTMHRPKPARGNVPSPGIPQKPGATSPLAAIANAARNGPPAARPPAPAKLPRTDSLLPNADTHRTPARARTGVGLADRARTIATRHWRRILVLAVVAVALSMSVITVWPVLFSSASGRSATSVNAAQEAVATDLLRTVVGGGRTLWSPHHSFAGMTPATLSAYSYRVPVVASTKTARTGAVSLRVDGAGRITLATPADSERCVFARDEPAAAGTRFVTVRTGVCRASAAPATGWASR